MTHLQRIPQLHSLHSSISEFATFMAENLPLRMIRAPHLTSLHLSGLDTICLNGFSFPIFPLLSSLTVTGLYEIGYQILTTTFPSITIFTSVSHQQPIRLLTLHLTSQNRPWPDLQTLRLRVLSGRTQERKYDYMKAMRAREGVQVVEINEEEWSQLRW